MDSVAVALRQREESPDEFDRLGSAVAGVLRKAELTATKLEVDAAATKLAANDEARQLRSTAHAEAKEICSKAKSDAQATIEAAKKTAEGEAKRTTARAKSTAEAAATMIRDDALQLAKKQNADSDRRAADIETAGREQGAEHTQQRREIEQSRKSLEWSKRAADEDLKRAARLLKDERQALLGAAQQVVDGLNLSSPAPSGDSSDVIDLRPEPKDSSDERSGRSKAEPAVASDQQA